MRKMKRILAATLAMTVLFATSVMAAQTPREILSQAYAHSANATTSSMTGNISGTISMMGMELIRLSMDLLVYMDVDMDTGTMKMYMRMPMQISGTDPLSGESLNENVEIAIFMDGSTMFVYESTIGWFTDPSMDMGDMDIFGDMDIDALMTWFMDINEQVMDEITIQFAADQVDGYYVIEQFMDWDDLVNMMDMIFTSEFFEGLLAFMPEEDLAELDLAMAELDEVMDELMEILESADITLDMVYRSYIDVETLHFHRYLMNMVLDFSIELDIEDMGNVEISGNFVMDLDINYNPTIVWPVIDEVATLDDVLAALDIYMTSLTFGEANLEERAALMLTDSAIAVVELEIEDIANFNVFIVNHGSEAVTIALVNNATLANVFVEVLQPGEGFVQQIPAGTLGGEAVLAIEGGGATLNVETGFRLTNYPLSTH